MFRVDAAVIGAAFVALIGFFVSWLKRGEKLTEIRKASAAKEAKNEIINEMGDAVPDHHHIDRLLGQHADD